MGNDARAEIYLDRAGRFQARIGPISKTGHPISEDSGCFTIQSILTRGGLLCFNANRIDAETDITREWQIHAAAHTPKTSRDRDLLWDTLRQEQRIADLQLRNHLADIALRQVLKAGDRLRATKAECGSREATFTFSHWDGGWIMSTGTASIAPGSVYSINGKVFRV